MRDKQEQVTPSYLIATPDQPRARVVEEKPTRIPTFKIDVLAPAFVFGLFLFLGSLSLYGGFWPGAVACGGAGILFLSRLNKIFDNPLPDFKEVFFQDVTVKQADPQSIQVNQNGQYAGHIQLRGSKTIRGSLGNIELSGRQLDRLLKIIDDPDGDGKYRRETSGLGKGVMEIGITTGQDPILKSALKERGYIDENQFWTDEGRRWVASP